MGGNGLAGNWNCARGAEMLREKELEQTAFESQQGYFSVVDAEHLRQHHADVQRRHAFAQDSSEWDKVLREDDLFFDGRVFRLMGHRALAKFNFQNLTKSRTLTAR